jgi:hypothetical protein
MDTMPDGFFSLNNPIFLKVMLRFAIDMLFLFILIKVIYFRYTKKEKFVFTFFLMGIIAFFISSLLSIIFLDMTFAFGIFAVFGILRLRTRNISVKDMVYTFITIGISMINALEMLKFPFMGVLIINIIIVGAAYVLEEFLVKNRSESYTITYENMELLKPDKKQKLLKDVSEITGKDIMRCKILNVNYKKNRALLQIFYKV